jgi:hypothetical protein
MCQSTKVTDRQITTMAQYYYTTVAHYYRISEHQEPILYVIFLRSHFTNGRHDTQYNDIQHNDTQHNDTQHIGLISDIQQIDTRHNNTLLSAIMLSVDMLNVVMPSVVALTKVHNKLECLSQAGLSTLVYCL